MEIVFSERALDYGVIGHPESPERIKKAYEYNLIELEDLNQE